MAVRKNKRGSAIFFAVRKKPCTLAFMTQKGESNTAIVLYHISLKPARLYLPSFEQVFLDLPLLQFAS